MMLSVARAAMTFGRARQVLGVGAGASADEVKTAFRAQALRWHPDRNTSPDAAARFLDCREAAHVLEHAAQASFQSERRGQTQPHEPRSHHVRRRNKYDHHREKEMREAKRCEAADAAAQVRAAVSRLRLEPGVLLVAAPENKLHGASTAAVVLLIELDPDYARGVRINTPIGGRDGRSETVVFHSVENAAAARAIHLESVGVFVDEFWSREDSTDLSARLEAAGHAHVVVSGHSLWTLDSLVLEIQRGDWSVRTWGKEEAQWWLRMRPRMTPRSLWRRAIGRLRPP